MSGRAYEDERRQQPDVPTTTASTTRSPTSGPGVATANSHPSRPTSPRQRQEQELCARGVELPPLPPPNRSTFSPPSTTRLAGVSAILNPASTEVPSQGRRRKASDLDSLGFSQPLPPLAIGSQPSADPARGIASPTNVYGGSAERQGRRVLTPRSPSLHRTMSLGHLHPTPVTTGPQQSPWPGSPRPRTYTTEPGTSGAPPLPTPPAAVRSGYGFSAPTPPSEAARRASSGVTRGTRATSGSASPTTSYSSYSQAGQTSPAAPFAATTATQGYPAFTEGAIGASTNLAQSQERHGAIGIPISSSGGQNTYQMMTLETTSGTVQLPVDVQAASRVADEKRRRNAGASARFRQRRKEKEKEASVTIGRLEQQVKELTEDVDFYRREREYLSGVILQSPGGDRHFPRPLSPRRRRSSHAMPGSAGPIGGRYEDDLVRSPRQGRNVRRRTSTLSMQPARPPPPPPAQTPQHPPAPYPPNFAPQGYNPALAPPMAPPGQRSAGPLPSSLAREGIPHATSLPPIQSGPLPPQIMQAAPQTGPWNPYAAGPRTPGQQPPRDGR